MKTEEERKEAARLATKKWNNANREKKAANNKEYYLANKEKARDYAKKHNKTYREAKKDGLFTVYCLPEENYVGMTSCFSERIRNHKSANHNRNIKGAYVLGKYKTKREALDVESSYHAKGYLGNKKLQ